MKKWNFYNEIEPYCIEWIKNLIKKGLIPDGEIDSRPIQLIQPDDVRGFVQAHFFCGIAGFPLALKLAGFPSDREIWSGSCPCQPFSVAGKGKGEADERHLWPHLYRLISACRPPVAIGEQVGGAAGLNWLDGVFDDLESQDYSCQAFNLSACSVNAPHIRERLYWVSMDNTMRRRQGNEKKEICSRGIGFELSGRNLDNAQSEGLERRIVNTSQSNVEAGNSDTGPASSNSFDMADTELQREGRRGIQRSTESSETMGSGQTEESIGSSATDCSDMADTNNIGRSGPEGITSVQSSDRQDDRISIRGDLPTYGSLADTKSEREPSRPIECSEHSRSGELLAGTKPRSYCFNNSVSSYWRDSIWITGADGKTRRAPWFPQSGLCGLAHGVPEGMDGLRPSIPLLITKAEARAAKLKALGNAIVPQLAAEVIKAIM